MIRRLSLSILFIVMTALTAHAAEIKPYEAASFETAVAAGDTVIAHVHADWCPVCVRQQKVLTPLVDGALDGKAEFFEVNFDTDTDFLKTHKVPSQSVIIIFKGGKEIDRLNGTTDAAEIQSRLSAAVS